MKRMPLFWFGVSLAVTFAGTAPAYAESPPESPEPVQIFMMLLEQFEADPEARAAAAEALRARIDVLRTLADGGEGPAAEAQQQLSQKQAEITELETRIQALQAEIESVTGAFETAQQEAQSLLERVEQAKEDQADASERLTVYEQTLALLDAITTEPVSVSGAEPAPQDISDPSPQDTPANVELAVAEANDYYTAHVASILRENCVSCHGPRRQKGGLRLDTLDAVLEGSATGPVVLPGNAPASRLLHAIHYDGDIQMPPAGKLPQDAIDALTAWINEGIPVHHAKDEYTPGAEPTDPPADEGGVPATPATAAGTLSFNHDILPILSDNCFTCHGPDASQRKAGLRLDTEEGAFAALASGVHAIVGGNRDESELWHRITSENPADRMPPPGGPKDLSAGEIALLGQWIDEGAKWQQHWAFIPPERPAAPDVQQRDWPRNPIDNFVLAQLEANGIAPASEADKHALLRRVTFDLTGLPPTMEELEAFLADDSPDAYENVVDRLLASERFGEHLARYWLDLARYADTNGYHIDNERFMWRWRDWVIDAFNANKPYDEFTIEQLAGDLLPDPTLDQLIATGFNRNHMINFEGGAIPEEYRVQYVVDRVNTTGEVWMAMTLDCARCHDHKYDPISMAEYYQLFAFYNTVPEEGLDGRDGNAKPFVKAPLPDQQTQMAALDDALAQVRTAMYGPIAGLDEEQRAWEEGFRDALNARWSPLVPVEAVSSHGAELTQQDDLSILVTGENPDKDVYEVVARTDKIRMTAIRLEVLTDDTLPNRGPGRSERSNFVLSEFEAEIWPAGASDNAVPIRFSRAAADFSQTSFDIANAIDGNANTGWAVDGNSRHEDRTAIFVAAEPFGFPAGSEIRVRLIHDSDFAQHNIGRFRLSVTDDPALAPSALGRWYVSGPYVAEDGNTAYETEFAAEGAFDPNAAAPDGRLIWVLAESQYPDGEIHDLYGEIAATYLFRQITAPTERTAVLSLGSNDAIKVWLNGEVVLDQNVMRTAEKDQNRIEVTLSQGANELLMKVVNYGAAYAFYFNKADEQLGGVPLDIELILAKQAGERNDGEVRRLLEFYRRDHMPEFIEHESRLAALEEERKALDASIPTVMVMKEMEEPRETFILARGQYDQPAEPVFAATPSVLPPLDTDRQPDRLALAEWLVGPDHPLTARVAVNRYWLRYFGVGIVKTAEDFGVQGERPSHPDLLDWLAREFIESGWDIKHLQRLIVTSATYRQDSRFRPGIAERDPENRLLARGPRVRLDAEVIRDNALAVSGLLVEQIGGPSVKPYQPAGIWEEVAYGAGFSAQTFTQDQGDALYRRSMYTFWKRQAPPPGMMVFDAPNREVCTSQRSRTNTPLQALALLNDVQYVEAARAFAERVLAEAPEDPTARVQYAFCLATARMPTDAECAVLLEILEANLAEFQADTAAAEKFIQVGDSQPCEKIDPSELAAYTTITSVILNLDETVTKS